MRRRLINFKLTADEAQSNHHLNVCSGLSRQGPECRVFKSVAIGNKHDANNHERRLTNWTARQRPVVYVGLRC
jgi:hypothetical protein